MKAAGPTASTAPQPAPGVQEGRARLAEILRDRLAALSPSSVEIRDDSAQHVGHAGAAGGAGHFSVMIVSEHFLGMPRLARHRAVLECVGDLIPYPVHALAIQAYAPNEPVPTKG
jgi:BolA protein